MGSKYTSKLPYHYDSTMRLKKCHVIACLRDDPVGRVVPTSAIHGAMDRPKELLDDKRRGLILEIVALVSNLPTRQEQVILL